MEDKNKSNKSFDWDEIMPEKMKREWLRFFLELYHIESLYYPRYVKLIDATEELPWFIVFSDSSQIA